MLNKNSFNKIFNFLFSLLALYFFIPGLFTGLSAKVGFDVSEIGLVKKIFDEFISAVEKSPLAPYTKNLIPFCKSLGDTIYNSVNTLNVVISISILAVLLSIDWLLLFFVILFFVTGYCIGAGILLDLSATIFAIEVIFLFVYSIYLSSKGEGGLYEYW